MIPTAKSFKQALELIIDNAIKQGFPQIDVNSGQLHSQVGGYPSHNHRMRTCCSVMRQKMNPTDKVIKSPLKGNGAELTIRYLL